MTELPIDFESKTENSELFEIFQKSEFENQDKRYEATIEVLDEFHKRLYAQQGNKVANKSLNDFKQDFKAKYSSIKDISKDDTSLIKPVLKTEFTDEDSQDITVELNLPLNSDSNDDISSSGSQGSDSDGFNYEIESLSSSVQVEDESVKEFLESAYLANRKGAHDFMAADFYKRKQLRSQKKSPKKPETILKEPSFQESLSGSEAGEEIEIETSILINEPGPSRQK